MVDLEMLSRAVDTARCERFPWELHCDIEPRYAQYMGHPDGRRLVVPLKYEYEQMALAAIRCVNTMPAIIAELTALRAKAAAGDRSLEAADALATSAHDVDELLLEENDRGNACIECGVQGIEGGPDDEEHEEGCRTGKLFAAISFYRTMRGAP